MELEGQIEISDYLKNPNQIKKKYAECKRCGKLVRWSRDRLMSHKRSNCLLAKAEPQPSVSFEPKEEDVERLEELDKKLRKSVYYGLTGNKKYSRGRIA